MGQFVLDNASNAVYEIDVESLSKEENFAHIFEIYYKRVYNYIYYRINDRNITEDLTSEVFKRVLIKMETYSEKKAPFEVWLFTIARNMVNDHFRSVKKQKIFSLDTIMELISREKNPEDIIVTSETNTQLLKAVNTLDKRERNIVGLKFGGNLKNKEIAQVMNITESNVGVILYRSMRKLKKELEGVI